MILLAMSAVCSLPGCVVWEIRDEMRRSNDQLTTVYFGIDETKQAIDHTNKRLDQTNDRLNEVNEGLTRLDRTNVLIDDVQRGLGRIDTTNTSLDSLQAQLALLRSMNVSMSHLDSHLASLRKTIGKLDSAIPFLDLGGDTPIEEPVAAAPPPPPTEPAPETTTTTAPTAASTPTDPAADPAATTTPANPTDPQAAGTTPAAAQPARRDPLSGSWIRKFPDELTALVLAADGTFVEQTRGTPIVRGTWTRSGSELTLTHEIIPPTPTPPPGAKPPATPPAPPAPQKVVRVHKILSQSARSVSLALNDQIVIYTRP